ncbi:MAG TPA: ABC transporter ATP-binding protein [Acholeplasmataceae bacterium]|jgi:multiple sugar transport system ATP-binding protein|nr:ABC transporter ATP-binding protein [Acholeplasmataceae bacterium]
MDIRLVNLTKIFADKQAEVRAVDDFDVHIPSGKLIGLLGPSGCGKSTTLYMIAGLLQPTEGQIFFGDDDVTNLPPEERGIGLVFQNYALYPHMTVRQNIMFPLENLNVPKKEALERAQKMADLVGIGDLMNRKPKQLSGGQQQRVAIARALVKEPRVLLLDEPLSNLDARLRLQTREEIKRIQRETGITTIFVTHDQEEAMSISDEIIVMDRGEEQQIGKPQDVYNNPNNEFVAKFLGTPPIAIFNGQIKDGNVLIGDEVIGQVSGLKDQQVNIGIRPEGYVVKNDGALTLDVKIVEHIGRDISLVVYNENVVNKTFRAIVDSDINVKEGQLIKADVKPNKCYIFEKETGKRLL